MDPVYYPSVVCHLRIRFDEAFHVNEQPDPVTVLDLATNKLLPTFGPATVRPLILEGAADRLSIIANRIPQTMDLELLGPRQAHTFKAVFDWRDMPIDPRLIRAIGIEIHVGTVNPSDFATGVVKVDPSGARRSILNTSSATVRLVGIVDRGLVRHNQKGSSLEIEGRDLRGILLDSPINPAVFKNLDLTQPIDAVVRQILERHPFGKRFIVEVSPDDWIGLNQFGPALLPSPGTRDRLTRVRRGLEGDKAQMMPAGAATGGDDVNFWDLITNYCFLVGAVPYFFGERLRIRPARTIFDQRKAGFDPSIATPFAGGKLRQVMTGDPPRPEQFAIRRFVYGRNIDELTFERKYTGVKARVVKCVSIDTSSNKRGQGKLVVGQWPDRAALKAAAAAKGLPSLTTSVAPSGRESAEEVLTIPIPGVRDPALLRQIAQDLFEEIGRGEMGGSVTTIDLASFGGDNGDPDNLSLMPGDAVELLVDGRALSSRSPAVAEVINSVRRSFEEQVAEVRKRLGGGNGVGNEDLARVFVASARSAIVELQNIFRVSNVKIEFANGVIRLAFDYQNFVEVRSGVTPSSGPNKTPIKRQVAGDARSP